MQSLLLDEICQVASGQVLSLLTCREASSVRGTSTTLRSVVERLYSGETETYVTSLTKWAKCFPAAHDIYVARDAAAAAPCPLGSTIRHVIMETPPHVYIQYNHCQAPPATDFLIQISPTVQYLNVQSYWLFPTRSLNQNEFGRLQHFNVSGCMVDKFNALGGALKVPPSVKVVRAASFGGECRVGSFLQIDISACYDLEELIISPQHLVLTPKIFATGLLGRLRKLTMTNQFELKGDDCLKFCSRLTDLMLISTTTNIAPIASKLKRFRYIAYLYDDLVNMLPTIALMTSLDSLSVSNHSVMGVLIQCSSLINLRELELKTARIIVSGLPASLRSLKLEEPTVIHDIQRHPTLTDLHLRLSEHSHDIDIGGFVSLQSLSLRVETRAVTKLFRGLVNLEHLSSLTIDGFINIAVDDIVLRRLNRLDLAPGALPSLNLATLGPQCVVIRRRKL
eukprot:GILJ01025031.1.p1 GENE.GILJ01025031.1~~GILJ01025031.1.p1  ORF type:complete len:452 (+),score=40.65 GILJ01025031.1:392-1747(+)